MDEQIFYLTGDEVAEILNISKSYAYELMNEQIIPVITYNNVKRVRSDQLLKYIQRERKASALGNLAKVLS